MPKQLFFKLLIGFWLICVLIAGAIIALPVIIDQQLDPKRQLTGIHLNFAARLANSKNLIAERRRIERSLIERRKAMLGPGNGRHKTGRRNSLFVIDELKNTLNQMSLPRDIAQAIEHLQHKSTPGRYHFKRWVVFGPYQFVRQGEAYQLYVRELKPKVYRHYLATLSENRWLLLLVMMLVSGICCAFLAWHITRPIKSLQATAKLLASGNLSARAEPIALSHRDEIGQLAHSFNEMASSVEQTINNQQRLLSDISHELRTPLTRLQLALAIARRQDPNLPQAQRIEQEANSIDKMLQQLLVLSRFRLNDNQPFSTISVDQLLEDIIDNAIFEARQYDKEIIIRLAPDISIEAQSEPLRSAIENVIRNAILYASSQVTLSTETEQSNLIIIIEDDGCGVEPQHLTKLFDPFYRVSSSRERSSGGTGLGLAIASEAIARHHGTIVANNANQGGLSVKITIPIIKS